MFVGLGLAVEWLFARATARSGDTPLAEAAPTPRLKVVGHRLMLAVVGVLCFGLGSIGAFLLFTWPPQFRRVVIGYLAAVLAFRVALELCRFLFAPDRPALRVVPMSDEAARFWTRWTAWFVGWFAFGYVTIEHLLALGVSLPSCQLLAYVLGFGLLAIALRMIWRPMAAARRSGRVRATILVLLIWLVWIAGCKPLMWALIVIAALPVAIRAAHGAVQHLFRREGEVDGCPRRPCRRRPFSSTAGSGSCSSRSRWPCSPGAGASTSARWRRRNRPAPGWPRASSMRWSSSWSPISCGSSRTPRSIGSLPCRAAKRLGTGPTMSPDEGRRRARLRTLLPILRIVLFVVLAATAILMGLSALGVQIGP